MVKILAKHSVLVLLLFLLSSSVSLAQAKATGGLRGTVTDPQGGLIPWATILAKNEQTGLEFSTVANEIGFWLMAAIPSGIYTVTITAHGFKPAKLREIISEADRTVTVDATLQIGFADKVVVTASKFEQQVISAPATVSVITEKAIQILPSQNVTDLLRAVPGMNVTQNSAASFGVNGRMATAMMPGAQLALIDGRTLYQDYLGFVSWNVVPTSLDEIKQIEVLRGPASAVWGAYALNGVVNIITKPPREMLGTSLTLGIGTFDRSDGAAESDTGYLYYLNAAHAQALNNHWAFKLTGGVYTQDAFARPQGEFDNVFQIPYPPFTNEGTTQPKVDMRVDYSFPDGRQYFTFGGGFASSSGIQHGGLGGSQSDMSSGYGKVDYGRNTLRITGYVNNFVTDGPFLIAVDPTGTPIRWDIDNQAYHFELSDFRTVGSRNLISYGGSFRHAGFNIADAPEAESRNEVGAYLQDEFLLSEHFRWVMGVRIDKFDFLRGVLVSPRTTFMVIPAGGQTIRLSYNRAYVAPSVIHNYWRTDIMSFFNLSLIHEALQGYSYPIHMQGNKDLKEQSLNAYEVGYTAAVANNRVNLGAAFYINDSTGEFTYPQTDSYTSQNPPPGWPLPPFVLDLLIAVDAFGPGNGLPSQYTADNLGKVRNKGFELNTDVSISRFIDGFANYSWQAKPKPKDFDISLLNLPPTHRFNSGMNFNYRRYWGNVSVSHVGTAYWRDVAGFGGWTDSYTTINATAAVSWGASRRYTAMLKISNLANESVQNHIYGDILKRQITGELRMRF